MAQDGTNLGFKWLKIAPSWPKVAPRAPFLETVSKTPPRTSNTHSHTCTLAYHDHSQATTKTTKLLLAGKLQVASHDVVVKRAEVFFKHDDRLHVFLLFAAPAARLNIQALVANRPTMSASCG